MGKGGGGLSHDVQNGILNDVNSLTQLSQQQAQNALPLYQHAAQLYNLTEPGMQTAENFYQSLASGQPGAIMRAINPAVQQITSATAGAKKNILENTPSGGEKNLALEMADANQGAQIGGIASQAFLNAPNALASLAGQGIGESLSSFGTGISGTSSAMSGLSSATSGLGSLGNLQLESQQLQAQQKGAMLGGLGSLAQTGIAGISGAMGGGGWEGAFDAMAAL